MLDSTPANPDSATTPRNRRWLLFLPAVIYALVVFPFVYRNVLGEPDLVRMTYALMYGTATGLHSAAIAHYGIEFSFGYYLAFYKLASPGLLLDSASLITAINYLGYVSAVLCVVFLTLYCERLYGSVVAPLIAAVFAFSPIFLELGTSGHPMLPASMLLFCGSWLLAMSVDARYPSPQRILFGLLALAITTGALCARAEVAFAFPFLVLAGGSLRPASVRNWVQRAAVHLVVLSLSLGFFLYLQSLILGGAERGVSRLDDFMAAFYRLQYVPRGIVILALASGVASMIACALLAIQQRKNLPYWHITLAAALALPTLAFWLPNPSGRHFLFASLAVAMLFSILLVQSTNRLRIAVAATLLLSVANQVSAELLYRPIVDRYNWSYPQLTERRSSANVPIGASLPNHFNNEAVFNRLRIEGIALASTCETRLLVFADDPFYMVLAFVERDPSVKITMEREFGAEITKMAGRNCEMRIVGKESAYPGDVVAAYLEEDQYRDWPIYFQEATRTRLDKTVIPLTRLHVLEGSCTSLEESRPRCPGARL